MNDNDLRRRKGGGGAAGNGGTPLLFHSEYPMHPLHTLTLLSPLLFLSKTWVHRFGHLSLFFRLFLNHPKSNSPLSSHSLLYFFTRILHASGFSTLSSPQVHPPKVALQKTTQSAMRVRAFPKSMHRLLQWFCLFPTTNCGGWL